MSRKIILTVAVLGALALLLKTNFRLRKETELEKTYQFCLAGVTQDVSKYNETDAHGITGVYLAWRDWFPWDVVNKINDESILMLSWEPYLNDFKEKSILPEIASGEYDSLIYEMAMQIKKYANPVFLRFAHEMNGNWYPWCGVNNDNSPENYKKAFVRIKDIFNKEDCQNAYFVFSVNNEDMPGTKWNRFENYYPGKNYVDILGIDAYNWGNTQKWGKWFWMGSRWQSPGKILEKAYERLIKLAPEKPIVLTEIASSSSGGNKKKWLEEFFYILPRKYKAVKGFVWFDIDKETDWAVSGKEVVENTFKNNIARDDHYVLNRFKQELFK